MAERGTAIATLRLVDVGVRADSRIVLHGVSLEVADGTRCALVGASGAGKTTTLRAAAGLVAHWGRIEIAGRDVTRAQPHRRGIAMLFQDPRLFDTMTVLDNVAFAARARGVPRLRRRAEAKALLDEVGLGDRAAEHPTALSGGERQRVALARALTASPSVLLLDEPLSALDAPRRAEVRTVIDQLQAARALTTLYVSHDLADAIDGADRLAVLVNGQIAQHDAPDAVLARPATAEVARLTGNPNLLVSGSTPFTIRPEHVQLDDDGEAGVVVAVDRRITHDVVAVDTVYGTVHTILPAGRAPAMGARANVTLPDRYRWPLPRATQQLPHLRSVP